MLAQPEMKDMMHMNETTIDILATGTLRRVLFAAALVAVVMLLGAVGCSSPPERKVRAVTLSIETLPPGLKVTAAIPGSGSKRELGASPVSIGSLKVVRKVYSSGVVDYWLVDDQHELPLNPHKPEFASPDYLAGNDYPLELRLTAAAPGHEDGTQTLRIDRTVLADLFERDPTMGTSIVLSPGRARPRVDEPQASTEGMVPRD